MRKLNAASDTQLGYRCWSHRCRCARMGAKWSPLMSIPLTHLHEVHRHDTDQLISVCSRDCCAMRNSLLPISCALSRAVAFALCFTIVDRPIPDPFLAATSWWVPQDLDIPHFASRTTRSGVSQFLELLSPSEPGGDRREPSLVRRVTIPHGTNSVMGSSGSISELLPIAIRWSGPLWERWSRWVEVSVVLAKWPGLSGRKTVPLPGE